MTKRKVPSDSILKTHYINEKMSSGIIAEKYGCARGTVCRHLRRLGITRPEEGTNSRNRNFHKKQYRSGYPVTFLPNHPRANHLGYVFDHILVLEKKLGRTPTRQEPIHHVDFDRKNCSVSNLHLCASHKAHGTVHASLENIANQLFRKGIIGFEDGRYYIK